MLKRACGEGIGGVRVWVGWIGGGVPVLLRELPLDSNEYENDSGPAVRENRWSLGDGVWGLRKGLAVADVFVEVVGPNDNVSIV